MTVSWQKIHVPLAAGMQNRANDQALEPPALEVCKNAEFDELGGIRKRLPRAFLADDPGGGLRRVVEYDDELVVFTGDQIYSYSELDADLVSRGTYLAASVTEASRFTRTSEQAVCDRAELSGVVVMAWRDEVAAATIKLAAYDKSTGSTLLERTISGAIFPKLVALNSKILLFYVTSSLKCLPLDPSSSTSLGTSADATPTTVDASVSTAAPAISVVPQTSTTAALAYRTSTATMRARTIDETGATTQSLNSGRTCTACTAIAVAASGLVMVVRDNTTNIEADILTSALVDSTTNVAVGSGTTTINQIAAAFKATQDSGQYRAHIFWSSNEQTSPSTNFECKTNWVDDAGAKGTESVLVNRLGVASAAFTYTLGSTSRVLVWLAFGVGASGGDTSFEQLQNTYFLYDADGNLHGKAAPGIGGGYAQITGYVPSVQAVTSKQFAAALIERRQISLDGDDSDFAQRSPREVILDLDSRAARRTAQLGRTLYISGAQVSQYDGVAVHELGFAVAPYNISGAIVDPGNVPDGSYTYRVSARWENARGELERSTSLGYWIQVVSAGPKEVDLSTSPTHPTSKTDPYPAYEVWRTAVNPTLDAPSYLVTSKDPTASGNNGYLENDPSTGNFATYVDDLKDGPEASGDYLTKHETFPENGGVLANIAPPSATIIAAGADRLWLAGIAGNPYRVGYSKLRGDGELAQFNDGLYLDLPSATGDVTAISFVNDTPIAFCERGIYALIGAGFDNLGGGQNYAPRLVSADVGAKSADAVAVTPDGVIFHADKGWHLLDRGLGVRYVGAAVSDFDTYDFRAVLVSPGQHQIRCFGEDGASAVTLVLDTVAEQWSEWDEPSGAVHACMLAGRYVVAGDDISREVAAHGSGTYDYSLDLETAWIKLDGLQGFRRIRKILILGEYRAAHRLRVRIAYDYASAWVDDTYWTVSPTTAGEPEQVEVRPSRPKGQAIKIRITDRHTSTDTVPTGDSVKLSGLALELGTKRTLYRALPAAQKA